MANESKLGLLSGIAVLMLVAVFFQKTPAVSTAFSPNETPSATAPAASDRSTPPPVPPAAVSVPDHGSRSIWQPSEPRETKPVSRDPLLWP